MKIPLALRLHLKLELPTTATFNHHYRLFKEKQRKDKREEEINNSFFNLSLKTFEKPQHVEWWREILK
ncbi:CLUMA_CG012250, isoform A [Clunio marinus]|uniref:CLUMA_CG012250, isoform A n=1 Tax=Clunio marinus TaxID=568069 RepID=A0A1J1IF40_9DIPT|nr:CLUMA_CG012250, isoform A [Clunio marinus]